MVCTKCGLEFDPATKMSCPRCAFEFGRMFGRVLGALTIEVAAIALVALVCYYVWEPLAVVVIIGGILHLLSRLRRIYVIRQFSKRAVETLRRSRP